MATENSDSNSKVKILFFPFMAQGHMLPMVTMANLFASRGVHSIILTTPANATLIPQSSTNLFTLHIIPFPSPHLTNLPPNCENVSSIPNPSLLPSFFSATALLHDSFAASLTLLRPDCVVTDMFFPWTYTANIPRIVFHGTSLLHIASFDSLSLHRTLQTLPPDSQTFVVPGIPRAIQMRRSHLPDFKRPRYPVFVNIEKQRQELDPKSFGVLVNTLYDLESEFADYYRNVLARKAWLVGPISLLSARKTTLITNNNTCIEWLNSQSHPSGSVVYICFGSVTEISSRQLRQIALALKALSYPFIWVVRKRDGGGDDDEWIPDGFEEGIEGRGMVVRGWAPQVEILNHESVGCFVTHCGWNSNLEGISAGVAMVTWPLFGDQFYNEKLIVDVLGIGVAIGVDEYEMIPEERRVVGAERIREVVESVMEGEGRRRKVKELGERAKRAVKEGGSSYDDVGNLIQELLDRKSRHQHFSG